ncbi:hypothetical protein Pelo_8951 [Pelomyxa schiedti]|nr:hypothetical protein Pelo_8951 [Pelomyxa schiedti]
MHSNRLVKLNVGGTLFTTSDTTLSRGGPHNFLTTLVAKSASSDISVVRDDSGALFIDRPPRVFAVVLDYLRTGVMHVPPGLPRSAVMAELSFMGIDCEFVESFGQTQAPDPPRVATSPSDASEISSSSSGSTTLYVGNLPAESVSADLTELISTLELGIKPRKCTVPETADGHKKKFGFVEFDSVEDLKRVLERLDSVESVEVEGSVLILKPVCGCAIEPVPPPSSSTSVRTAATSRGKGTPEDTKVNIADADIDDVINYNRVQWSNLHELKAFWSRKAHAFVQLHSEQLHQAIVLCTISATINSSAIFFCEFRKANPTSNHCTSIDKWEVNSAMYSTKVTVLVPWHLLTSAMFSFFLSFVARELSEECGCVVQAHFCGTTNSAHLTVSPSLDSESSSSDRSLVHLQNCAFNSTWRTSTTKEPNNSFFL